MHRLPTLRRTTRTAMQFVTAALLTGSSLMLAGCQNFFVCQKASCPTTSTGTSSGDYAYVANSSKGSTYLNGYDISSGKLTALSGFPTNISVTPSALAITPGNTYLYASTAAGSIYAFSIGSAGVLATVNNGSAVAVTASGVESMDISADGNYLFALDATGNILYQYAIFSSGLLGSGATFSLPVNAANTPQSVRVAPNENFVVCALGIGGDAVFAYSSTAGITNSSPALISTGSSSAGDFGIAIDTANYLYLARTTGPAVYLVSTTSAGVVTATAVTQSTLTTGSGPHSIALSSSGGGTVYVGNLTGATISGYTASAGVLSNLSGSPFTAPTNVSALSRDKNSKYIVATGYNSSTGTQIFTIGSTGALTLSASDATGTSTGVPTALALTH